MIPRAWRVCDTRASLRVDFDCFVIGKTPCLSQTLNGEEAETRSPGTKIHEPETIEKYSVVKSTVIVMEFISESSPSRPVT